MSEARGTLRDALSALQNLLLLLRSLRVGPRPISAVLAEIRQSVEAIPGALLSILSDLGLDSEPASQALLAFAEARSTEAQAALAQAEHTALEARARLALEAELVRLLPQLDAVRDLTELLALACAPPTDLDAAELLEAAFTPPSRPGIAGPTLQLSVEAPRRGQYALSASPQAAVQLLHIGAAYVGGGPDSRWKRTQAGLRVAPADNQLLCTLSERASPRGDVALIRPPMLIAPTAGVVALFAARGGLDLRLDPDSPRALLGLPLG